MVVMLHLITPAPLAIPAMCIPPRRVKLWIFGQKIVVIMACVTACATGNAISCRVSIALGKMSEESSLVGNLHPRTPVLEGNTDVGSMDNSNLEAAEAHKKACKGPPCAILDRLIMTGVPGNMFLVKHTAQLSVG
jgi:hypothetical protein